MKHTVVTFLAAAAVIATSLPASAQTIKLGTLAPEGSPWHTIIRDMAEAWAEASDGAVDVTIYAGGIAGDEHDMVRKMRIGQLHAAVLTGEGLSGIAPQIQALQMPMLIRSYAELDYVRDRLAPELETILESNGFKVLNWGDAGWVRFFARRPVVQPDDLRSLRLFAWSGDTVYIEAWKAAGFQPVPLAATELIPALQSGLVDAFASTPVAALSFQWFGLANHMTEMEWAPLIGATVISTRVWARIPDDVKPLIVQAARDAGTRIRSEIRGLDDTAVEVMRRHGLDVHAVEPAVAAEWERVARASYPMIVGRLVPPETIAEVERLLDEFRASR